jgi:hypothetical protein
MRGIQYPVLRRVAARISGYPLEPVIGLAGRRDPMLAPCDCSGRCDHFGLSAAAFLHSDMNFLRSLPWTPLVSASVEHSREAAVRGFSAFAGAIFVAGAGVAGAVACANAELIRSRDAKAVAAAREDIVIMGNTSD